MQQRPPKPQQLLHWKWRATVAMPAKSDGKYLAKFLGGEPTMELEISGNTGYVLNGAWYFDVLEFNPPHLKLKIQATGSVAEFNDVVKA